MWITSFITLLIGTVNDGWQSRVSAENPTKVVTEIKTYCFFSWFRKSDNNSELYYIVKLILRTLYVNRYILKKEIRKYNILIEYGFGIKMSERKLELSPTRGKPPPWSFVKVKIINQKTPIFRSFLIPKDKFVFPLSRALLFL